MSETFDLFTRNNKNSGNNELNEQDQINSISISMTNTEKKKKYDTKRVHVIAGNQSLVRIIKSTYGFGFSHEFLMIPKSQDLIELVNLDVSR